MSSGSSALEKGAEAATVTQNSAAVSSPSSRSSSIADEASHHLTGFKLVSVVTGLSFAVLLVALDTTLLATAIPTITSQFNSLNDVGWYSSTFLIASCACIPLAGKMLAQWPSKTVFLVSLFIFEVGSLVCALAPSSIALILGRVITGVGAAGLLPGSLTIIAQVCSREQRPLITGIVLSTFSMATVIGPIVGGALTQHVTWRWCFYINLPLGAVTFAAIVFIFKPIRPSGPDVTTFERIKSLDLQGFALFSPAVIMLLLALQWGGTKFPWRSSEIIGLFIGFGLTITIFAVWQSYRGDRASLPPRLFKDRTIALAATGAFLANATAQVVIYYLPLWFQAVQGVTPTESGVRYLPSVISNVIFSIAGGGFVSKVGFYNPPFLFGLACMALGSGLLSILTPSSSSGMWIGFQVLFGVGYGLSIQIPLTVAQTLLPSDLIPMGASLMTFCQLFGGSVLVSAAQTIFQSVLARQLHAGLPPAAAAETIHAGATGFRGVVQTRQLPVVVASFNSALVSTFYAASAATALGFVLSTGMRWTRVRNDIMV